MTLRFTEVEVRKADDQEYKIHLGELNNWIKTLACRRRMTDDGKVRYYWEVVDTMVVE